jgi:hypothetical protein
MRGFYINSAVDFVKGFELKIEADYQLILWPVVLKNQLFIDFFAKGTLVLPKYIFTKHYFFANQN